MQYLWAGKIDNIGFDAFGAFGYYGGMKLFVCSILAGVITANGMADPLVFTAKVGAFEVHTLVENQGQGNTGILLGASAAGLKQYIPKGTYRSEVNTFLIRSADRIVLVDTGFGRGLFDGMSSLGVRPEQVDAVLLTHLHGDHIGGLQRDGKALFPKAAVYLAQQEQDYWTKTNVNQGAVAALTAYGSRVRAFRPGALGAVLTELLPGITPIAAFGHTPGHTAYLIESAGARLLIWGDLMHVQDIQFPVPEVSVTYDTDPAAAAATRKQLLDYAVQNKIPIAGMHLVYPAMGTVSADRSGYRFSPMR